MANTFKNTVKAGIGTVEQTVYTAPSSVTSTIIGLTLAGTTSDSSIRVNVKLTDYSTSVSSYLIKNAEIPYGASLVLVGGEQKVILEGNDYISVTSSVSSSVDVVISILETS